MEDVWPYGMKEKRNTSGASGPACIFLIKEFAGKDLAAQKAEKDSASILFDEMEKISFPVKEEGSETDENPFTDGLSESERKR